MDSRWLEKIKYWGQLFLLPLYLFSFISPRNNKIWVFGSTFGRRFSDNPKYLYLYLNQNWKNSIRPIWITRDKGIAKFLTINNYEAYYYLSIKGIFYSLIGKVYIFDNYSKDINFWTSGGALKVNLWHGVGNKKINYDNVFDKVRHPRNRWEYFKTFLRRMSDEKPSHYILATSSTMRDIFASAFRVDRSHIIEEGYPRNDYLLSDNIINLFLDKERECLAKINYLKCKGKIINLYMPTFRDSEIRFLDIMNLESFNEFLKVNNIIFVTKLHPKSKLKTVFERFQYSNIINLDAEMDPYIFLKLADILTTDYSSVYSDFMLLDRPVIAFQYDFDVYSKETREGYFDFDEYMPEVKAISMENLMSAMLMVLTTDMCKEKRKKSREMMFKSSAADACENISNKIIQIISKGE